MAELDVEKKKNNDWWKWLLGVVALLIIVWVIIEALETEEVDEADDMVQPIEESPTSSLQEKDLKNTYKYNRG